MGEDRTWTIHKKTGKWDDAIEGPDVYGIRVVEEYRLAEAEARAERLEAELREAGDTFSELAIYLEPDEGQTHNADACGVDACIFCLAEARAREARDRARGVLEKDKENA